MTPFASKISACNMLRAGVAMAAIVVGPLSQSPAWAAPPSVESQRHLDSAAKHVQKGNAAAAVIELKNAILADGANTQARYELALLYLRGGDSAAAQRELETARQRGFDENKIAVPLAQAYFAQGRLRDVITKFAPAKLEGSARVDLLATQARAHIALQERAPARALIDQGLALDAAHPGILMADTILLRLEGDFARAEAQIDKALAKEPGQPEFMVLKAELRQQQKDFEGAERQLDLVIQRYPEYLRGYIARAQVKIARRDMAGAKADVDHVLGVDNRYGIAHYLNAYMLVRERKHREAAQLLIGQSALLENFAPAAYLLAVASFADDRLEIARTWAQRYAAKAPDDVAGGKLMAAIHMRQNSPARAAELLERFTALHPRDAELKTQLANAYLGSGRSDQALKLFEEGAALNPNSQSAQLALAMGRLRTGDIDQATDELHKALESDPGSVPANTLLVITQLRERMPQKALATTAAMIAANPNDPHAHNLQGTVHLAANDIAASRAAFEKALQIDPKFVAAALNLARIEERGGEQSAARNWYNEALRMDPDNATALDGLASLALQAGDYEAAAKQYELAIARDPAAGQPRLKLVELYLQQADNARALNAAREFAAAMPEDAAALEVLGRTQLANGDFTNGIGSYRRLVGLVPESPEAHRRLGRAYAAAAGREKHKAGAYMTEARLALDRALELSPDYEPALADRVLIERDVAGLQAAVTLAQRMAADRESSIPRLLVLGDMQSAAQQPDTALASYRKAWGLGPDTSVLRRLYGALAQSGRDKEGLALLREWAERNPADYDTRMMISSHYITAKQYDMALKETEAMNTLLPNNPVILNNLAWLYGEKNDPQAVTVAERAFALAPRSADVADTLGWLHVQKGDVSKGVEIMAKAHALAPDRADITYRYARALEKKGDKSGARTVLQKALSTDAAFSERPQAEALLRQLGS